MANKPHEARVRCNLASQVPCHRLSLLCQKVKLLTFSKYVSANSEARVNDSIAPLGSQLEDEHGPSKACNVRSSFQSVQQLEA